MQALGSRVAKPRRAAILAYAALVVALSLWGVFYFVEQNAHLVGNDHIYYISIAESLLEHGTFEDRTISPPRPVRTPQNGVVAIYAAFFALGASREQAILALVTLGYLLHLSALFPLDRILRRAGLQADGPRLLLVATYGVSWQVISAQLAPGNDGIFNALAIWLLALLLDDPPSRRAGWAATVLLAAVLVQFRLQALLVTGPVAVAAFLLGHGRQARRALGATLAALLSLTLASRMIDSTGIAAAGERYARISSGAASEQSFLARLFEKTWLWGTETLPELLFADGGLPMNLLYVVFALGLGAALVAGRRGRRREGRVDREADETTFILAVLCAIGLMVSVVFLRHRARYAVYLFPYLYLLLLRPPRLRAVGALFAACVLLSTPARYLIDIPRSARTQFWLDLRAHPPDLGDASALLLSEQQRYPYFYLERPEWLGRLPWEEVRGHGRVLLIGTGYWIDDRVGQIAGMALAAEWTFERRIRLGADRPTRQEMGIVELYNFRPLGAAP